VLGAGEADAPEPEVVRTPRSGVPLRHRVGIVVPPGVSPAVGWSATAPRALAEPRLEIWAQGALGDPSHVRVGARTLVAMNLSALDVLYDADGGSVAKSTLALRLRLTAEAFGDDPAGVDLTDDSPLGVLWDLAGLLRATLLAGRPLDVGDVGVAQTPDAAGRVTDAYLFQPAEVALFFEGQGFATARLMASQSFLYLAQEQAADLRERDPQAYEGLIDMAYAAATDASILGISGHLLYAGTK